LAADEPSSCKRDAGCHTGAVRLCRGSVGCPACRLSWWKHCADYFPTQLIKTADLDPDGRYIFVVAPHGRQASAGNWDVSCAYVCSCLMGSVKTTASQLGISNSLASLALHVTMTAAAENSAVQCAAVCLVGCAGIATCFCWPCFDTDPTGFSTKFPGARRGRPLPVGGSQPAGLGQFSCHNALAAVCWPPAESAARALVTTCTLGSLCKLQQGLASTPASSAAL
jgi:hypothetical protein